jgi:SOS-response transcriptional repressor LexA
VPLVGQIAAGVPIIAQQEIEDEFLLPRKIGGSRDNVHAQGDWRLHDRRRHRRR